MKLVSVLSWIVILIIGANFSESSKAHQHKVLQNGVSGSETHLAESPFFVFLYKTYRQHKKRVAAAALLNKDWVLTTAIAIDSFKPTHAHAGITDENSSKAQVREISKQLKHPEFNTDTKENDISLLKVSKPFDFNQNVKAIPMNRNFLTQGSNVGIILRYVSKIDDKKSDWSLHVSEATTVSITYCRIYYRNVPNSVMCLTTNDSEDPGIGILGTPMVYNNSLVGISNNIRRGYDEKPDLYTRLSPYTKWVETTMEKN